MGLGYALSTATLFQAILKTFIGGLRPHFLAACQPIIIPPFPGSGYQSIWHTPDSVCNGDEKQIREAQMSFPSGHSSAAFAGFGFLALYLNAKFKILGNPNPHHAASNPDRTSPSPPHSHAQTDNHGLGHDGVSKEKTEEKSSSQASHWKLLLFVAPWLIATTLAASKVMDYWHHPTDCIAGGLIGIVMAHLAYGMVYRGVYDARVNHVPREY